MIIKKLKQYLRPLSHQIKHTGWARKCPVCGRGSRRFLEFGVVSRPDASCPFCGALERHRLLWLFLHRQSGFFTHPPDKALHVAPEPVFESRFRQVLGDRYTSADLFDPKADVKMDITDIQYPDSTFDFIYCSHVLEHVDNDRKAMKEFLRVLTHTGLAILLVPITTEKTFEDPSITDPNERLRVFGQKDHVRCYGPDFVERLIEAGFAVETLRRDQFLTPDEIVRMGISKEAGDLFICRNPDNNPDIHDRQPN